MLYDFRQAFRVLRQAPTVAAACALCIALGVGANTAIFSAVAGVLLRPLGPRDVSRVVVARNDYPAIDLLNADLSPPEVLDLAARRDLFAAAGGYVARGYTLQGGEEAVRLRGVATLGAFYDVFGVRPLLGRLYGADASSPGNGRVAVLSHALWRERFGGDPGVVGRPVRLGDASYEVVAVLPPDFRLPRTADVYTPYAIGPDFAAQRGSTAAVAVLRLRPGVTPDQARAAAAGEARAWRERYPENDYAKSGHALRLVPFAEFLAGQLRPVLGLLVGAVALVLFIACANVSNLQLVRAVARAREFATRAALGETRGRLARRLLAESLVLALVGGAAGLALGAAITWALAARAPESQPALRDIHLDGRVFLATAVVSLLAAVLSGALPALRGSRVDLRAILSDGGRGGSPGVGRQRLLGAAVVLQLAFAQVLLVGAGLMLRSLGRLLQTDPGFRPASVVTAALTLPASRYGETTKAIAFYDQVLERLRGERGVEAVAVTSWVPFTANANSGSFQIRGREAPPGAGSPHANIVWVSSDYFRAMGIPLRKGRTFGPEDDRRPASPDEPMSAIIDERLARTYFPGEDPIGRRINQGPELVIVGVVGAVAQEALGVEPAPTVYYNYRQGWWSQYSTIVRSGLPADAAGRAVRRAARELDPTVPVYDVRPMDVLVRESVGARRFGAVVLAGFAALALVLALLGIYGVVSYVVAQRRKELGVRVALGASGGDLARLVLAGGARLALFGVAGGTLGVLALGRVLGAVLYGVGPRDPALLAAGGAVLGAAAVGACYLPARRAAAVDPSTALRGESA